MIQRAIVSLCVLIATLVVLLAARPATATDDAEWGAYQAFQGGQMFWLEEHDVFYILYADFSYTSLAGAQVATLADNPITDTPPAGFEKPISGFGRIWGNFPAIRQKLGWANGAEYGYTVFTRPYPTWTRTPVTTAPYVRFRFETPTGSMVDILHNGAWRYNNTEFPPRTTADLPASAVIPSSYRTFEHGFMVWFSATGEVWAFNNNGTLQALSSSAFGSLPDVDRTLTAPAGLYIPVFGFGKVWGNFPTVRDQLGFSTQPSETGFRSTVTRNGSTITITAPDGRTLTVTGTTWR